VASPTGPAAPGAGPGGHTRPQASVGRTDVTPAGMSVTGRLPCLCPFRQPLLTGLTPLAASEELVGTGVLMSFTSPLYGRLGAWRPPAQVNPSRQFNAAAIPTAAGRTTAGMSEAHSRRTRHAHGVPRSRSRTTVRGGPIYPPSSDCARPERRLLARWGGACSPLSVMGLCRKRSERCLAAEPILVILMAMAARPLASRLRTVGDAGDPAPV